ncbi:MAG: tetraacyldisaccharide 4'-kinase [Nitrospiraceae bacterium]|nr:tetraacyldisaccharide 4'-kinase [Nitrospiraceae bacterium]
MADEAEEQRNRQNRPDIPGATGRNRWIRPLLQLAAIPYSFAVSVRNLLYDHGWKRRHTLPCRVVSVGNVTVGGTGKTPLIIWITQWLLAQGFKVAVLSRGYRRTRRASQLVVSDGGNVLTGPDEAGDEPYLIATCCRGAVVAVGSDRYRLGRWVLDRFAPDYMLLDDGFQHRSLQRDVDIVLIDASDHAGLHALLPAGRLREPLSAVSRASAIVLTRADTEHDVHAIRALIKTSAGVDAEPILVRFEAHGYVDVANGAAKTLQEAAGRRAVIFSGIGNPASFRDLLIRHGVKVEEEIVYRDHYAYTKADLNRLRERAARVGADLLLTTEKDAVKITSLLNTYDSMWAVKLSTAIVKGRERLERLIVG